MSTVTDRETRFGELQPNHPVALETYLQLEDFERVSKPELIEATFKLHALFTPHLVLHEAQLFDHAGMRNFFSDLDKTQPEEFRALVAYLTDPGRDPLGLGPVVVASEYDPADPTRVIPLDALLMRKLGVDNPSRVPWQFGSIGYDAVEINRRIREATGIRRYKTALDSLGPTKQEYPHYLELISNVWDRHSDITRFNLPKPDYGATLLSLLGKSRLEDREAALGEQLREALSLQRLTFKNGKEITQIDQTSVLLWVGDQTSEEGLKGALWTVIRRAHPEAFVRAFPARVGWLSAVDPTRSGYWAGVERAAGLSEKLPPATALGNVSVKTGGQLLLDKISYRELYSLRANGEFQQSLRTLNEVWANSSDYSYFMDVLTKHVDLIYGVLGAKKKSSSLRADGPNVVVDAWHSFEDVITAIQIASVIFPLEIATMGLKDSPRSLGFAAAAAVGAVVVKNLYRWTQPKREWAYLTERVGGAAKGKQVPSPN